MFLGTCKKQNFEKMSSYPSKYYVHYLNLITWLYGVSELISLELDHIQTVALKL